MRLPMGVRLAAVLTALTILLGCAYVPSTRVEYAAEPIAGAERRSLRLAVERLREERPPRHWPSYTGRLFLTYVPLLPWVKIPYERLDESFLKARGRVSDREEHDEHFTRKIAVAIAEDLRRSSLFEAVEYVDEEPVGEGFDLVLGGSLRSTQFDAYASSYMLGMPGVLLWLLPVPVGRNAATVEMELELRRPDGEILWREQVEERSGQLFLFYSPSAQVAGEFGLEVYRFRGGEHGIDEDSLWAYHADALRRAMKDVRPSLREALPRALEDEREATERGP